MEQREEEKREHPEGTIIQTAACPFCGQIQIREGVVAEVGEEELEEYARLHCDCTEACAYQKRIRRWEKAKDQILSWFGGEESEFTKKAAEIVRMVQEYKMDNATLVDGDGRKLRISISGKGNLKIGVSRTETAAREIE